MCNLIRTENRTAGGRWFCQDPAAMATIRQGDSGSHCIPEPERAQTKICSACGTACGIDKGYRGDGRGRRVSCCRPESGCDEYCAEYRWLWLARWVDEDGNNAPVARGDIGGRICGVGCAIQAASALEHCIELSACNCLCKSIPCTTYAPRRKLHPVGLLPPALRSTGSQCGDQTLW